MLAGLRNKVSCSWCEIGFYVPEAIGGDFPQGFDVALTGGDEEFSVLLANNVINRRSRDAAAFFDDRGIVHAVVSNHSITAPGGSALRASNFASQAVEVRDNLHYMESNSCFFYGSDSEAFLTLANRRWKIDRNFSDGPAMSGSGHLPLGSPHPTPIRLLSLDPLDRNFMRVDPDTISVPPGDPFPGALPPGPAPPEDDWFTRLQERFREALQYVPEGERGLWTRSIELPKPAAQPQAVAVTDSANQNANPANSPSVTH